MPFVKGQSGNPKGRPKKGQSLAEALRTAGRRHYKAFAQTLWQKAVDGDTAAMRLILEFLVGKAPNQESDTTQNINIKTYITLSPDEWPDKPPHIPT